MMKITPTLEKSSTNVATEKKKEEEEQEQEQGYNGRRSSTISTTTSCQTTKKSGQQENEFSRDIGKRRSNGEESSSNNEVMESVSHHYKNNCSNFFSKLKRNITNMSYKWVKVVQLIFGIYILLYTFTPLNSLWIPGGRTVINPDYPEQNEIGILQFPSYGHGPSTVPRPIIAENLVQMILLGISRFSAFFSYPAIILVFWSKFRGLHSFLEKTPISVFLISDTHKMHVYCGYVMFFDALLHTTCHLARWGLQGNLYLLTSINNNSGITGLIAIISICFIVLPMTLLKKNIQFEIRKYAHYLFWILCLVMTFHAPIQSFPNGGFCGLLFPLLMIAYGVDAMYVKCFMSERITTPSYKVLQSGVELTMPVSDRFQKSLASGGFGYVMLPWISKHQWHAYSLYENPLDPSIRHMFLAKAGDWTSKVHRRIEECHETARPLWITGPFPSPYNNAYNYDSMVLVAAGIGITPALSCIEAYKESRRVNLIWAVRDASMLVFFLENAKLDERGLNLVFYTGKEELPETIENFNVTAHVKIIRKRPDLSILLPNIVEYFERRHNSCTSSNTNMNSCCKDKKSPILEDIESGIGLSFDHDDDDEQSKQDLRRARLLPSTIAALEESSKGQGAYKRHSLWKTNHHNDVHDGMKEAKLWDANYQHTETSRHYVKYDMPDEKLERWGLMYCGSRNPLLDSLVKESKTLNIPLHEEAFDW